MDYTGENGGGSAEEKCAEEKSMEETRPAGRKIQPQEGQQMRPVRVVVIIWEIGISMVAGILLVGMEAVEV